MILDIPLFKCFVKQDYITDDFDDGFTEAYCFAVTILESRPLLFTVHTIDGAVYSRLPIWALVTTKYHVQVTPKQLDCWGAISSVGGVIEHKYLKDYKVKIGEKTGKYAFTIDYFDGGFSQDPEQHKCSHVVFLDDGTIGAFPNNMILFLDDHFVEPTGLKYRRNKNYYTI